jgi:hypothetical protein
MAVHPNCQKKFKHVLDTLRLAYAQKDPATFEAVVAFVVKANFKQETLARAMVSILLGTRQTVQAIVEHWSQHAMVTKPYAEYITEAIAMISHAPIELVFRYSALRYCGKLATGAYQPNTLTLFACKQRFV